MTINLANNNPRANYTATSGQTAFTIPFDYFDDSDINVYQNGTLKTITTHYTISGSTMTLVTGATAGDKIAITRDVPLERTTDLTSTYSAASVNDQLDTIVAQIADLDDRVSRSISLNDYEVGVSLDLPATSDRLGKTIQFNSSDGSLEVGPSGDELTSIASIASQITALEGISSNITTVAGAITNVNNVGGGISSVNTVATNISNINTVNTSISNVNSVAGSISDVTDVADSIDQVELVAGSISNVDIVGPVISNVNTVASDISNINTLAAISSNITTVAGITSAISTVNSNAADITTVNNNIDDVNDVANVITKVTTVADNITNVNTLSSQASNIGTLAGISGSINSLGAISSDITTLAAVASDVGDAATNAASALSAKNAAEAARDATLSAYDNFDDRYLGAKSEEPTLDNDNNPLVAGSLYFDTNSDTMKLYTGSAWVAAYIAGNDYLPLSGGTLTGQLNTTANIAFGDNDKAVFGAGSDLAVFSNGTDSFIQEYTTGGHLYIDATNLRIRNRNDNTLRLQTSDSGAVDLYYSGSTKLSTSSTGVDISGVLTSDGLTVSGDAVFTPDNDGVRITGTNYATLRLEENDTTDLNTTMFNSSGDFSLYTSNDARSSLTQRLNIDHSTGNISFYNSGGSSQSFFWDASAESLVIGASSTATVFEATGSKNDQWAGKFTNTNSGGFGVLAITAGSTANEKAFEVRKNTSDTAMLIDGLGNIGVGTSSPTSYANSQATLVIEDSGSPAIAWSDTGQARDWFAVAQGSGLYFSYADGGGSGSATNVTNALVLNNGGNVGIGTDSPSPDYGSDTVLEVSGSISPGIVINDTGQASKYGIHADSNDLKITYGSGALATFQNDGKIGIGTTAPASLIHGMSGDLFLTANSTSADSGQGIYFQSTTSGWATSSAHGAIFGKRVDGSNGYLRFDTRSGGTTAERMRIDSSGNVGIGEVPQTDLNTAYDHLQIGKPANIMGSDAAGGLWLNSGAFFNSAGNWEYLISSETVSSLTMTNSIPFRFRYAAAGTAGNTFSWSEAMRINSDGHLLIGNSTSNTDDLLQIETPASGGGHGILIRRNDSNSSQQVGTLTFGNNSSNNLGQIYVGTTGAVNSAAMVFQTTSGGSSSETMRIDSSGNVIFGAGAAVPSSSAGGAAFDPNTNGRSVLKLGTTSTGNQGLAEFFNPNGKVGDIVVNGSATAFNTSSDYRLKTDAQPMTGATDRLKQLNPVNFEWIADGTRVDGFLAHEAQAVVPEAVTGAKDAMRDEEYEVTPAVLGDDGNVVTEAVMGTRSVPDYQGIDQSKLVPLLVATIQELEARITALENA